MNTPPISRRTLLSGLGASLALPALELMGEERLISAPKRFCSFFQPNGVYPGAWNVTGLGAGHELSPILSPLQPVLGDFSLVRNLENVGGGHVRMTGAFLSGREIKNQVNGVSLDQQIAQLIGHHTTLPSVELGTEPPRQGNASGEPIAYANTVSWSSPTTRVSPEINPQVAFDRLFRDHSGPEMRKQAESRRSVIDLVLDDAKSLRRRAGTTDQAKLDEYLESVRAVEVRLDKTLHPPEPEWIPTTSPEMMERPAPGLPRDRSEHLRLMIDMLVLAFWTDTTRVGTMMTAHGFSRQNFSFLPGVSSDHHGMSHHKNKADAIAEYTTVSKWYIGQFAYFLQKMKSIKEGDRSLLDNSVVLYGSGMKDGNGHVRTDLPLIVAGRGGGALKSGQYLTEKKGAPHANLLHTLGLAMGLEQEQFNESSTGVIDGLLV